MLRAFFVFLSKANWAQKLITRSKLAWRVASRFVAGDTLQEAVQAIRALNRTGILATLDQLGENTTTLPQAAQAESDIMKTLDAIQREMLRSNISIKLTVLGLLLDENACITSLRAILERAKYYGNFVRIDMEDSALTQKTLDIFSQMRREGFENVGVVIQSYLFHSLDDIRKLGEVNGPVRLCKGAYKEPANIAYPLKKDVDEAYDKAAAQLLENVRRAGTPLAGTEGRIPPLAAIATHDEVRIRKVKELLAREGLPKGCVEFQMLYGIRRDLQQKLVDEGYPVRIYVPFGTRWYPYFMRRLGERPANVWFFVSALFKR
jgi:proline dehydrogenase